MKMKREYTGNLTNHFGKIAVESGAGVTKDFDGGIRANSLKEICNCDKIGIDPHSQLQKRSVWFHE